MCVTPIHTSKQHQYLGPVLDLAFETMILMQFGHNSSLILPIDDIWMDNMELSAGDQEDTQASIPNSTSNSSVSY